LTEKYLFLTISENKTLAPAHAGVAPSARLTPCKWGKECRTVKDPQHTARFSHPT